MDCQSEKFKKCFTAEYCEEKGDNVLKIAVIGSEFFGKFVQNIVRKNIFPHIQLEYINDITFINYPAMVKATLQALERENCQAFVLGPYDYSVIAPHTNLPCYVLHPDLQEFLLLYPQIRGCKNPAVICPTTDILDLSVFEVCFGVKYHIYYYEDRRKIEYLLEDVKRKGHQVVIGSNIIFNTAKRLGLNAYYYFSQKSVEDGIRNAEQIIQNLARENQYIKEISTILENATCGVIYLMRDALTLNYVNRTALEMLQYKREDFFRLPIRDMFPQRVLDQLLDSNLPKSEIQFSLCGVEVIGNIVSLQMQLGTPGVCLLFEKVSNVIESEAKIQRERKRQNFGTRYTFEDIIGDSEVLKSAIAQAKRFALSNSTILIHAESGAGKELFAQSIHNYSVRHQYPFVAVSCASIPDTLIESELFGYAPNSFTGASTKGKRGLLEIANHGTVFLDDVDALSPSFQSKLLRVLQEREVIQIGGDAPHPVDVRFIVSTNRDLKKMVEEGQFRNDLYFRLNVLHLRIPPLRDRSEDIPTLIWHFLRSFNSKLSERVQEDFAQVFESAFAYSYPGNIRELINIVERFAVLADVDRTDTAYFTALCQMCLYPDAAAAKQDLNLPLAITGTYKQDIANAEKIILQHYYQRSDGNISELAETLGISRATLYNKLRGCRKH